jgi:hypothetical protein
MVDEPIPPLDECSDDQRAIYFFRNSIKTLLEIRSAIETLKGKKVFVSALSRQPAPLNKALSDLSRELNKAHVLVKRLRNEVAGHLPHKAFSEALKQVATDTKCLVQMGNRAKDIHYKFSLEFIGATMLRHVEFADAEKEWKSILDTALKIGFKAINSIDMLFVAYARIRNLSI